MLFANLATQPSSLTLPGSTVCRLSSVACRHIGLTQIHASQLYLHMFVHSSGVSMGQGSAWLCFFACQPLQIRRHRLIRALSYRSP
ncbi:unnamed protein product [Protopolystoma xenopodis]|uniref:Uncharacterized protein n=1 Tax=Protopolystoma xenopodis TaxID=117903 RepID=A0A3S5CM85_9PLAT|nr:unnamed protein product [Protopolystoma xenopodis]